MLTDFFTDGDLNAYVSAISGINGIKQLTLIIPNTAQNRNSNYIKNLFHTADSSLILVNVVSTFDRIKLDTTLINSLFVNRQISFSVVTGNFFKKTFPLAELDVVEKKKTFTIKIQGEVDSTITWLVDSNLGKLNANRISTLFVRAETTVPDTVLKYTKIAGNLPPGLVLKDNGEIIGKTPIFGNVANPGLTFFNSGNTIFDGRTTTFDRTYTFTVQAKDRFGFSAITREFSITIDDTDDLLYSNIFIKPYLKNAQRLAFDFFITSSSLIPPALVYRPSDPNFGVQLELRSLVYAGIQTRDIAAFVAATVKNHKPKRYFFGNLNTAVAKQEGTNDILYEVVYIELVDRSKPITGKAKSVFNTINSKKITVDSVAYETLNDQFPNTATEVVRNRPAQQTITIDNTAIQASQSTDSRKYISNIDNMRKNIKATGASSRDFLPLWMRTPQGSSLADLDYVFAIPLVYTIPGESETIRQNIENSGFDFNQIDYYIDRYIIDATTGNSQEQYILFANYQYNV